MRILQDFYFKARLRSCQGRLLSLGTVNALATHWRPHATSTRLPSPQEAKRLGYVARSAFKLQEIDAKHHVLRPGGTVLDLGCHPGAWLQVACQALGPPRGGGQVVGIDLQVRRAVPLFGHRAVHNTHSCLLLPAQATPVPVHCDSRVTTLVADARRLTPAQLARAAPAGFSAVLSDMAPATSGIASLDATRSQVLAELAVRIALGDDVSPGDDAAAVDGLHRGLLRPGGALVLKLLEGDGSDRQALQALTVPRFRKVHWMRPKATRQESCEVYLVATGLLTRHSVEAAR